MSLPVLPLRVLASRAVLAHGFDTRQLLELPNPLDREMEAYGRLQGSYRVKSINIEIEKVSGQITGDRAVEIVKEIMATAYGLVLVGQDIVVNRQSEEQWAVIHGVNVTRYPFVDPEIFNIDGESFYDTCFPEDGGIGYVSAESSLQQQTTIKLDMRDSLFWSYKITSNRLTATWACRTSRLRRSTRKT